MRYFTRVNRSDRRIRPHPHDDDHEVSAGEFIEDGDEEEDRCDEEEAR